MFIDSFSMDYQHVELFLASKIILMAEGYNNRLIIQVLLIHSWNEKKVFICKLISPIRQEQELRFRFDNSESLSITQPAQRSLHHLGFTNGHQSRY